MSGRVPTTERVQVRDEDLRRVQEKLVTFAQAVARIELLHGHQIDKLIFVGGTELRVAHKLGRLPLGWFVVGANAAPGSVWESTTRDDKILYLKATNSATVSLWVY